MHKLPILISVPHAGAWVPPEVAGLCRLDPQQILEDGDGGAAEIYNLEDRVEKFITTEVARVIVDLNRAPDDRRADGVIKTHTCWNVPVYRSVPTDETVRALLDRYYFPYHRQLTAWAAGGGPVLAVDCHTMAEKGPPAGPDPGRVRPWVCLSNGDGTCPRDWMDRMVQSFVQQFGDHVRVNDPFKGGYITRSHAVEMPWIQVELSRRQFMSNVEKNKRVFAALQNWVDGAKTIR